MTALGSRERLEEEKEKRAKEARVAKAIREVAKEVRPAREVKGKREREKVTTSAMPTTTPGNVAVPKIALLITAA